MSFYDTLWLRNEQWIIRRANEISGARFNAGHNYLMNILC